jgi:hypothetical protein
MRDYATRHEIEATKRPILQKHDCVKGTTRMRAYDAWEYSAIFADYVTAQC